ncbi:hypothetical protein NEOLEDRAFT_1143771 [Neolentinus lepideus HHB14362 ss-1]|uniref:Uncharacterized protein n=1 Tax=Neolentinus lepideus HHB14362 ss-1 TaxID=1314782 RepID=A0A165MC03_9AGAM|nr:hypothetical protein NEOLEDRAFT_1143771 [Neolentinus lepideus HHB14362 ss-1]
MHAGLNLLALALVPFAFATPLAKRAVAYYAPTAGGGSELDNAGSGGGEPLNVIISGLSSPEVLTDDGIVNFAHALGYSRECLDIHSGAPQTANLGDGNGWVDQLIEIREDYGSSSIGTCLESLVGGNHFRVWRQNGTSADSGALFLAVSKEEDLSEHHTIVANGYNIGRNLLVSAALGTTSAGDYTYSTTAENVTGLIAAGSTGVNHGIAQDGIVTVLTVTIV